MLKLNLVCDKIYFREHTLSLEPTLLTPYVDDSVLLQLISRERLHIYR